MSVLLKVELEPAIFCGAPRFSEKAPPLLADSAARESDVTGPVFSEMALLEAGSVVTYVAGLDVFPSELVFAGRYFEWNSDENLSKNIRQMSLLTNGYLCRESYLSSQSRIPDRLSLHIHDLCSGGLIFEKFVNLATFPNNTVSFLQFRTDHLTSRVRYLIIGNKS